MKINRRAFNKTLTAASIGISIPNVNFGKAKEDIILGQGNHRYRYVPNWADFGNLPVNDCHEMVQDSQGRMIFNTNELKNNIIICSPKGKLISTWGIDFPGAHGLTLLHQNGEDTLFITDQHRRQVFKTTVDGKVIFKLNAPLETGKYKYDGCWYAPTEVTVLPNGEFYVADGYGEQYITHYDANGVVKNIFGGRGEENEKFTQCHGIAYDNRDPKNPVLLITDRMKHQLKRFTLDGKYLSKIQFSNIWNCRPVVFGDFVYMAVLKCSSDLYWKEDLIKGCVLILDKNNIPVSALGANKPNIVNGIMQPLTQTFNKFQFPHDVALDQEGNIYVTQWNSGKVYPYKFEKIQ
ncbi:MAG: 6-bladed beta-propeller [Cytophagales bacterium]|nr:MAG: 6-bladed beta-propeller [Cytophagales bacterium]